MKKTLFAATLLLAQLASANASPNTEAAKTNYTETQWEYYAADEYAGGTGTAEDPYLIATAEQLMKLAVEVQNLAYDDNNWGEDYSMGKYWKQTADITLNSDVLGKVSYTWDDAWTETAIDASALRSFNGIGYMLNDVDYQAFAGTYDGGGHTISGFYCNNTSNGETGIFNYLIGGTVKNLVVKDAYVAANANIGLIVGRMVDGALVINCMTSGIVADGGSYHAGIAGHVNGSQVKNCVTDVWTWAKNNVGGIVAKLCNTASVENSFYYGWLGSVLGRVQIGDMKYWGAVCPEIGLTETTVSEDNPDDPAHPIVTCPNPSTASNCYWADTCSVRNQPDAAMVSHNVESSTYGIVTNCNAVAIDAMAATVSALNAEAEGIEGASRWQVGSNGMPELTFEIVSTGIHSVAVEALGATHDVYDITGKLVRKGIKGTAGLEGLGKGIYIMGGKKYVVR